MPNLELSYDQLGMLRTYMEFVHDGHFRAFDPEDATDEDRELFAILILAGADEYGPWSAVEVEPRHDKGYTEFWFEEPKRGVGYKMFAPDWATRAIHDALLARGLVYMSDHTYRKSEV